jgi:hypothetical protein
MNTVAEKAISTARGERQMAKTTSTMFFAASGPPAMAEAGNTYP